ncbi:barstar family protein [Winogradskyella echinorum]|uniref:Barstar family protein n=1 Tax=Winogradskyella echinorum TaxID=538189 RepID=A0ABR6Y257_9FLAO|nr:barstar family protein [Winogradskyella echinorum]MBC3846821.1 barstar family protein [Winogradskyella echinorum]MBC5751169.1 barstar family protein [Winogradskyella echinorum]
MLRKEIKDDNELYLYFNEKLIYKRWLNQGYSKVFDRFAYGKDTFISITEDENGKIKQLRKIFINGEFCDSKLDFWNKYIEEMEFSDKKDFGKNLDAFNDAITAKGPGFPGDCIIEIIGIKKLIQIFGKDDFDFIIDTLQQAEFVDLIIEKDES